jgi:hypothetical protein
MDKSNHIGAMTKILSIFLLGVVTLSSLLQSVSLLDVSAQSLNQNQELTLTTQSVTPKEADTFTASFSYVNSGKQFEVKTGNKNSVSPEPLERGQSTVFRAGENKDSWKTIIKCGESIIWKVKTTSGFVETKAAAPQCGSFDPNSSSSSSCSNTLGWIEDYDKLTQNARTYFIPRNNTIPLDHTPKKNPESYKVLVCNFTQKVAYKNTKDKWTLIDNTIEKLSKEKLGFSYKTTGNDYEILFPSNPNNGFKFTQVDGTYVSSTKITIDEKPLNWNNKSQVKLEKDTITYSEVLPSIDLQYHIDNEGFAKYFILKDEKALLTDLSKIEFTLDTGDKKVIKKNDLKDIVEKKGP